MRFRFMLLAGTALLCAPARAQQVVTGAALPAASSFGAGDSVLCHSAAGLRLCSSSLVSGAAIVAGRTIEARARDRINVLDAPYAAACDGATDDTAAVRAAFAAAAAVPGGAMLEVPQRTCLISAPVAQAIGAGRSIHLRGAGGMSGFVSANGSGIAITLTDATASFDASDLAFLRTGSGQSGIGLSVQATVVQAQAISHFRNLLFSGNAVTGGTAAWQEGLKLTSLSAPVIDGMRSFLKDGNGTGTGIGLHLTGVGTYLGDAKVSGTLLQGGRASIAIDGLVQGVYVANSEGIGSDYGIIADDSAAGGANLIELVAVTNSHWNNALAGIYLGWANQNQITNNLFLHFAPAAGRPWQAIMADHSGYNVVTGNGLVGVGATAATGTETFYKAVGSYQLTTITGNNLVTLAGQCVDATDARNTVVTGNSCQNAAEPGIALDLGSTSLAASNIVNGRNELVGPRTGLSRIRGAGLTVDLGFVSTSAVQLAAAGTTQADAAPLTTAYTWVSAVPSGGGYKLPAIASLPANLRTEVILTNRTGTAARVYPAGSDSIIQAGAQVFVAANANTRTACEWLGAGTAWDCRSN